MKYELEVCQIVYDVFKTQIQFGAYRAGNSLPTLEQSADYYLVSLDTIRSAYLKLQQEGYVKMSTNVGAMVIKDYDAKEIEQHVQQFFSLRKRALIDLSKSLGPLFRYAQWIGLKNIPAETYSKIQLLKTNQELPPLVAFKHVMAAYTSLGNHLLLRLLWQTFMFFGAPFFSVPENPWCVFAVTEYAPQTLDLCLKKDWESLRTSVNDALDSLDRTLNQFYEDRITALSTQPEISFTWSSYKKASQIRYSLAMDLLISISRGQYPANTLLPSQDKLAREKGVSVSTIRRALVLLNGIGATQSLPRVGIKVLPFHETASHCDFTKPEIRRRLMDMAQSLQIVALSCKAVSEITIASLDADKIQKCIDRLSHVKNRHRYELITFVVMELSVQSSPYQAIRTIYGELLRQLFWGYALRSIWKENHDEVSFYLSSLDTLIHSLEKAEIERFSDTFEAFIVHEFHFVIRILSQLGIQEAENLLIPDIQ